MLFTLLGCGRIWDSIPQPPLCISSYSSQVLQDNPVGYWRLNETTGSTAYNLGSGGGNAIYGSNTSLGHPPAILGTFNYSAYVATGVSPIAAVASYPLAPVAGKVITVELWLRQPTPGTQMQVIGSNLGIYNKGFEFDAGGTCGANQFSLKKIGVTGYFCAGGWVNDTNWHHVVYVTDATGVNIYVDGVVVGNNADVNNYSICDASCTLNLGGSLNSFEEEVAVYNTALTPARIQAHYHAGLTCQ